MRSFHERAMDCRDPVAKEVPVDVCLNSKVDEDMVFVESLSFTSFFRLMEAAQRTDESIRTSSSTFASRPSPMI